VVAARYDEGDMVVASSHAVDSMLGEIRCVAPPRMLGAEEFSLYGQLGAASSVAHSSGSRGDLASEFYPWCGAMLPSRSEGAWASIAIRLMQVTRFVHDGGSSKDVATRDFGTLSRSSWAFACAQLLETRTATGVPAAISDFKNGTCFVLMKDVLTRCAPVQYLLPAGTRCRALRLDGDGDIVADVPSAVHLCSGRSLYFDSRDCSNFQVLVAMAASPSAEAVGAVPPPPLSLPLSMVV
jgi:hypothetical protein